MKKTWIDLLHELPVDATLRELLTSTGLAMPDDFAWTDKPDTTNTLIEALLTWPDVAVRDAVAAKLRASVALGDSAGTQAMFQVRGAPFASGVEWLPLEERFTFYGGGIAYIPSGVSPEAVAADDPRAPIYGPFSPDFRWVTLSDRPEPIHCSEGQAAVFGALWGFKGQQVKAEAIMSRAGLSSDKPSDLFKVRPRDKGKPQYEAQHHAYEVLVECHKREGLYWMPCASPNLASA